MDTGGMAGLIGVPIAVATGGLVVSAYALGPARINRRLLNLNTLLGEAETDLGGAGDSVEGHFAVQGFDRVSALQFRAMCGLDSR